MNYFSFEITPPQYNLLSDKWSEDDNDMLTALLSDLPFDTFEDTGKSLKAFISEENCTPDFENDLLDLSKELNFQFEKTFIPYQNWNVLWESNFQPIQVGNFVAVRADFHPPTPLYDAETPEGVIFDLVINPKMAFGTGHHETTFMMMQLMQDIPFDGTKVLDYGCGTGVLAILASKLRATEIEAVDIELASFDNTIENCSINEVDNVKAFHGTLQAIEADNFDVILANINRNVILDSLSSLKNKLTSVKKDTIGEGILLISGFLKEDEAIMREAVIKNDFTIHATVQRGNWLCMHLKKN
jgi:ribosomal protein L11 methyltransferase